LQWISIGKLAKATGFAVERLRMWEQRYGAPQSRRLASGHRRYSVEEVERLHLVREALSRGRRPRHVVALKREALLQLLGALALTGPAHRAPKGILSPGGWVASDWVAAAARLDDALLDRQFYEQWLQLGSLSFLVERAQPFAAALSLARAEGRLGLAEERFGAEKLGDFLTSIWRRLNENNAEQPVLLGALPSGKPSLDLPMMALVLALAGMHVIFLGLATPLEELVDAAKRQGLGQVVLSLGFGVEAAAATQSLASLKAGLGPEVFVGVGLGHNYPNGPGFQSFQNLQELFQWARARAERASSVPR
jgi:hypothetical protein